MKRSEVDAMIGKLVAWDDLFDPNRGTFKIRTGTLTARTGNNVEIGGDWKWFPDLKNLRLVTKKSPWE